MTSSLTYYSLVITFDGVVHVPLPVVLLHVAEGGVDAALGSDGVAPRREQLGDDGGLEALSDQAEGGAQASSASAHDDGVVRVVDDGVVLGERLSGAGVEAATEVEAGRRCPRLQNIKGNVVSEVSIYEVEKGTEKVKHSFHQRGPSGRNNVETSNSN